MSVFTWMFVEGVHLYQMIVIAFVSRSMMKFYVALGWGKFNLLAIHCNFRALYWVRQAHCLVLIRKSGNT